MLKPNLEDVKKTLQKFDFPVDVGIEVTRFCNLECIMCPYPNLKRPKGEMKMETFKKIVDEVARNNPSTRIWLAIMGEPLLMENRLIEMIMYAKDEGIKEVNMNTNAVFMTPSISKKLIKTGVDKILVSIDAFTKETYDKIRIGGDFNAVVDNVKWLLNFKHGKGVTKPEVIAQFIVMDENEHETESFKEFWLKMGAVVKIRPKLKWGDAVESKILDIVNLDTERFPCSWLTRMVPVHWDGTFVQCDADYEGIYSPGNINTHTIKDVWEGELLKRRKRHWSLDFNFEPCKNCKDWLAGRSYFYYPEQ